MKIEIYRDVYATEVITYDYDDFDKAVEDIKVFIKEGYLPSKDGDSKLEDIYEKDPPNDSATVWLDGKVVAGYEYNDMEAKVTYWKEKRLGKLYD